MDYTVDSTCPALQSNSRLCIDLHDIQMITSTLVSVLKKSLGPKGQTTLCMSSTGECSMTKDGLDTLLSLHLSHPLAICVQQAARKLIHVHGDGCKTLVLYVNALINALQTLGPNQSFPEEIDSSRNNQMAKALQKFVTYDLPIALSQLDRIVNNHMQDVLNYVDHSEILMNIMSTFLSGCIPKPAVRPMATLIVRFLNYSNETLDSLDYKEAIKQLPYVVFIVVNKLYSSSYIEDGLCLQHPLIYKQKRVVNTNMIAMLCPMDGVIPDRAEDLCLLQNVERILQHRYSFIEQFLMVIHKKGVSLIVCSSKVPPYALQLCQKFDIAVIDCVEESDIHNLCHVAGKSPLLSHCEVITESCLVKVDSCSQFTEGQLSYSKIVFGGEIHWTPRSIFLCVPSHNLGKQLRKAVEKSLIVASQLVKGKSIVRSNEPESYCNKCVNNIIWSGGCFEIVLSRYLSDYQKNDSLSSAQQWCCNVISQMLLTVPQSLYECLSPNGREESKQRKWITAWAIFKEKQNAFFCLNSDGAFCNPLDFRMLEVEVLSVKAGVLYSALSLAIQMLSLHEILSVNRTTTDKNC